jgi:hypothetical protein
VDAGLAGSNWAPEQSFVIDYKRISGYVRNERSQAISGVTVTADNSGGVFVTDGQGYYEFWVPTGWTGTVSPAKPGYTFDPVSRPYPSISDHLENQCFSAVGGFADSGSISGAAGVFSTWGDYDNDGDLDLVVCGDYDTYVPCRIYRNENGSLTDSGIALPVASRLGLGRLRRGRRSGFGVGRGNQSIHRHYHGVP